MRRQLLSMALAAGAALTIGPAANGQCPGIDFEDYSPGTIITNQYPGVTFQIWPQSCQPQRTIYPIIVEPAGGTSSGERALGVETGCPDFSPDALWMRFADPQRMVTFTLGEQVSQDMIQFWVRAYNSDGERIWSDSCRAGYGVHRLVQVGALDWPEIITWIEIDSPIQLFETIDDLTFGIDTTAPTARIDSPVPSDCICDDIYVVSGVACDPDGSFGSAALWYQKVGADVWTLADFTDEPVCTPGAIGVWDTSGLVHGHYYLRLNVSNACGLVSSDTVYTFVDRKFGEATVTSPQANETLCGVVDILGSVSDNCRMCFNRYRVDYRPVGGSYQPVDPEHVIYDEVVINGTLATWDLSGLENGPYQIRVRGWDECGNTKTVVVDVNLDQSGPCGCPADLDGNGEVDFNDILQILSDWGLCPG